MNGYARWIMTASLVSLLTSVGQAEVRPSDIVHPANEVGLGPGYGQRTLQFHLDLNSSFDTHSVGPVELSRLSISPLLRVSQPVGHNEVEVVWGVTSYDRTKTVGDDDESASTFRIGNPSLTYFFTWRTLARQIRLGFGGTAPVARLRAEKPGQQIIDLEALTSVVSLLGFRDRWLWAPDSMSVIGHFDYYFRDRSGFIFGSRVVAAPTVRVGDSFNFDADQQISDPDDLALYGQIDLEFAFDTRHLRTAIRSSYSIDALSDLERDMKDQIALETEFRMRTEAVDVILSFLLNVDEPAGFSFDDGKVWSMRIGFATPTQLALPE